MAIRMPITRRGILSSLPAVVLTASSVQATTSSPDEAIFRLAKKFDAEYAAELALWETEKYKPWPEAAEAQGLIVDQIVYDILNIRAQTREGLLVKGRLLKRLYRDEVIDLQAFGHTQNKHILASIAMDVIAG